MCLRSLSTALEREMRHIVLCVSISTNELKSLSSALEKEMRHIVLCLSISTNELTSSFLSIGERNETHCSMRVLFLCIMLTNVLLSIGEKNKIHWFYVYLFLQMILRTVSSALEREMRHTVLCLYIYKNDLTTVSSCIRERNETHLLYVCQFLRIILRPFPQDWKREMRHIVLCLSNSKILNLRPFSSVIGERNENTIDSTCVYFYE